MSSSMLQFSIDNKTHLRDLIRKNPEQARAFLRIWIDAADRLIGTGILPGTIDDTAQQVGIDPSDILAGIISGCLNEQFINEQIAPILGKELLPIGLSLIHI